MNKYIAFFILSLVSVTGWAQAAVPAVIGEAYDLDGQVMLYRELHYYSGDKLNHRVVYQAQAADTDQLLPQSLMAEKIIDYSYGLATPAFTQQSYLFPETIVVEWADAQLAVSYQEGSASSVATNTKKISVKNPMVIDAGFDHFIREHWQAINSGKAMDFYYLAPTRQSLVELSVVAKACADNQPDFACFEINSANWFIRLILDPIEISYDLETKKLRRFRGLANLSGADGQALKVDIQYCYLVEATKDSPCPVVAVASTF
ncbi:hypothetical protein [Oceanicoccus sp. KOV_DT_Chl]|uniref:hypothetical protein n=1 Tax=Oceanicoccus sp. KOV_DT_Chl TaxID=1904639 RepID=UPI000C7BF584|nr:hypothetical protein [Oceanicoccus sp. KOV_DT_Chl]